MSQKRVQKKKQGTEEEYLTARRIIDLREERGWQKQDLAARMGVVPSSVGRVEGSQTANMSADTLQKFSVALGVSSDYLLGLTDIRTQKQIEVESLGLSEKTAETYMKRSTNMNVVNSITEHEDFPLLTQMIALYTEGSLREAAEFEQSAIDTITEALSEMVPEEKLKTDPDLIRLRASLGNPEQDGLESINRLIDRMMLEIRERKERRSKLLTGETFREIYVEGMKQGRKGRFRNEEDMARFVEKKLFHGKDVDEDTHYHFYMVFRKLMEVNGCYELKGTAYFTGQYGKRLRAR